jgi:K+-sensing histidine kinase KdpD
VTDRLIGDLKIMPPREIAYRGGTLKEMDPGAVWAFIHVLEYNA